MYKFIDIQKTLISISYKRSNRFQDCFSFERDKIIDDFQLTVHGKSKTGMTQIVHNIGEIDPLKSEAFSWHKIVKDVDELRKEVENIRIKLTQTRVEHLSSKKDLEDNHVELKESMTRLRVGHRDQLNRNSWTTYILVGILVISGCIAMKWMKEYIRKRDKIF